jgi:hypothetical protein
MKNIDPKASPERRAALKNICEPESFLPIVEQCVDPEQAKKLRPHHMANFMALAAELFLVHYDGIGTAFERNNGLEVTFKLKLAPEKDNVELAFKPVDVFKDSASAPLPMEDPNQPDLFKKKPEKSKAPEPAVEVESVPLGLPAPVMGLPAPELTDEEKAHIDNIREQGMDARAAGSPRNANPYPIKSTDRMLWSEGWDYQNREMAEGRGQNQGKSGPVVEAEIVNPDDDDDIPIGTRVQPTEVSPPARTEEEERAYQEGRSDFADGDSANDFNPYDADEESALYAAFHQGWMDKRKEHLDEQCVTGMLATTAPKFAKMLETVFSNCITQTEWIDILNLALTTERAGKSREWVISRLTEALTKTEQPVERTAFQQGEDAAGNDHITETANPYEPGTVDHDDWLDGFKSARAEA